MRKISTLIICILFTSIALSQQVYEEVVYLKNGSIIKGTIIEQVPDVSIKIQTKDGNIFTYQMEEIDRITKELVQSSEQENKAITSGVHQHDGFFIRLTPGLGYANFTEEIDGTDFLEFSGLSYSSRLQIGGAVSDNVIIYGELGGIIFLSPSMKLLGEEVDDPDVTLNISGFGAGISYYIMPANVYFALSLLVTGVASESGGTKANSEFGFGFNLMAGKEWWVGEQWGLGIAGFMHYSSMNDQEFYGETPSISNIGYGLIFSITYN
jgi:hypothetical protein